MIPNMPRAGRPREFVAMGNTLEEDSKLGAIALYRKRAMESSFPRVSFAFLSNLIVVS
jgi:hypothetical protein